MDASWGDTTPQSRTLHMRELCVFKGIDILVSMRDGVGLKVGLRELRMEKGVR